MRTAGSPNRATRFAAPKRAPSGLNASVQAGAPRRIADALTQPVPMAVLAVLLAMLATSVYRLNELALVLRFVKPALLSSAVGVVLAWNAASVADKGSAFRNKSFTLVAMFFCWCAITVPTSLYTGVALATINGSFPAIALMLVLVLLPASLVALDRLVLLLTAGGGALGLAALTLGATLEGRLSVTYTLDANDLGAIMAMTIPLALGCMRRKSMLTRVWAGVIVMLATLVLVRTGSRGAVVGLVSGTLLFALLTPGVSRVRWMIFLGIGVVVSWPFAPATFRDRILGMANLEDDYNTSAYGGRQEIWKRGRGYAYSHPVFGVGIGNFPIAEGDRLAEMGTTGKWSAAHNAYLQVAAELGFPGFAIFVTMLVHSARRALKWGALPRQRAPANADFRPEIPAAFASFLVCSIFLSSAYSTALYALLGMIALGERVRIRLEESAGNPIKI